ncbi:MAG TPA: CDP-alcohol phosphatidyltransferase family protein [Roseovarius sp.]
MTARAAPLAGYPAVMFGALSAVLLAGVWAVSAQVYPDAAVPALLFSAIVGVAGAGLLRHYAHPSLGACNVVTLLRAALVCLIAGAVAAPPVTDAAAWALCAIAALALAMDGLDGWLARRSGLTSGFGARFDMEIDALLGAVLSLIVWQVGPGAGVAVLLLGFMRYLFVGATWIWPWLAAPLPDSLRRKTVCVIQIAALIALLMPVLPSGVFGLIAYSAAALLGWSFAVDITHLRRERA